MSKKIYFLPVFVDSFKDKPSISSMFLSQHQTLEDIVADFQTANKHSHILLQRHVDEICCGLFGLNRSHPVYGYDQIGSSEREALLFLFSDDGRIQKSFSSRVDEEEQYYEVRTTLRGSVVVLVKHGFFNYLVGARERIPNLLSICHRRAYETGRIAVDRLTREIGCRSLEFGIRSQSLDALLMRLRFLNPSISE